VDADRDRQLARQHGREARDIAMIVHVLREPTQQWFASSGLRDPLCRSRSRRTANPAVFHYCEMATSITRVSFVAALTRLPFRDLLVTDFTTILPPAAVNARTS
jgi:hypothetical protein